MNCWTVLNCAFNVFIHDTLDGFHERGYRIMDNFVDPNNPFFNDVELLLHQTENGKLAVVTKNNFLGAVLATIDITAALNAVKEVCWEVIFNLAIREANEANCRKGIARYSSNSHFAMEAFLKPWRSRLRCFSRLYIGKFCSLIGLNQVTTKRRNFQMSGGRFVVPDRDFSAKYAPKDSDYNKKTVLGFLHVLIRTKTSQLWVVDWWKTWSHCNRREEDYG